MDPADKENIESKIATVKEAISAENYENMKSATEELTQAIYQMSEKIYSQSNPEAAGGPEFTQDGPEAGFKDAGSDE